MCYDRASSVMSVLPHDGGLRWTFFFRRRFANKTKNPRETTRGLSRLTLCRAPFHVNPAYYGAVRVNTASNKPFHRSHGNASSFLPNVSATMSVTHARRSIFSRVCKSAERNGVTFSCVSALIQIMINSTHTHTHFQKLTIPVHVYRKK